MLFKQKILYICIALSVIILLTCTLILSGVLRMPPGKVTVFGAATSYSHLLGWIGGLYLAAFTPFYSILKRKTPQHLRNMLAFHIVGNMTAVLFASVHFSNMVARHGLFGDFTFGIVLYSLVAILAASGLVMYFAASKSKIKLVRSLHIYLATAFYIVLSAHIATILLF